MKNKMICLSVFMLCLMLFGCNKKSEEETAEQQAEETVKAPINVIGRAEDNKEDLLPKHEYELKENHEVGGRQGIAYEDGYYYVSDSKKLFVYDENWQLINEADGQFSAFENEVNHIGDIDVYNGEIYAGIEYFMDGESKNIQIAVYDAKTLKMVRTVMFDENSGQTEVSGIAIDPDSSSVWMCSWSDGDSGRYLYRYDLENGEYLGKYHLQPAPQYIQSVACFDGNLYITADDGDADLGEADHIYRYRVDLSRSNAPVVLERTLDDIILQGEIEGLSFDKENKRLLVCYNHGARIVLGMGKGFYEGFDKEIHNIYVYDFK
ncbi:MAG: hypothetical protein K6A70_03580 [Erysipelotrichaceae bacterium]|nr:hypothetical protein [Erysipelotrichaceae bacterium]